MTEPDPDPILALVRRDSAVSTISPQTLAVRQFLRRNLLVLAATLVFMGAAVLLVIFTDRVLYYQKKNELMNSLIEFGTILKDNSRDSLNIRSSALLEKAIKIEESTATQKDQEEYLLLLGEVRELAELLMARNSIVVQVEVRSASDRQLLVFDEPSRIQRQNSLRNCLISRDYIKTLVVNKRTATTPSKPLGTLRIVLTTPTEIQAVEDLTREWRVYLLLIEGSVAALYGLLMWTVLLPLRRVIGALDKGSAPGAPIIQNPHTLLEKYYNNLARDATISLFSTALREFVTSRKLTSPVALIEAIPRLVRVLFPQLSASIWVLRHHQDQGEWQAESVHGLAPDQREFGAVVRRRIQALPDPSHRDLDSGIVESFCDEEGRDRPWVLFSVEYSDSSATMLVIASGPLAGQFAEWMRDVFASIAREVRIAMHSVAEQRRLILTEKSKANISLSRAIGHDLTNIIATSKLELMNVKHFLQMNPEEIRSAPQKQQIFTESLHSLLNNTRFLQEIVNLYRSFTYLSRPKFERVALGDLVEEVGNLFRLSVSRNMTIETVAEDGLAPIVVEPRLLKLALFNLLSNAADALKRAATPQRPTGVISLRVRKGEMAATQEVIVEDSGDGIRGKDGELLSPEQIEEIFHLGYTTKEKDSGEGLGLNWVQQIVAQFHGGQVIARNRPEGGAAFHVIIPSDSTRVTGASESASELPKG